MKTKLMGIFAFLFVIPISYVSAQSNDAVDKLPYQILGLVNAFMIFIVLLMVIAVLAYMFPPTRKLLGSLVDKY